MCQVADLRTATLPGSYSLIQLFLPEVYFRFDSNIPEDETLHVRNR